MTNEQIAQQFEIVSRFEAGFELRLWATRDGQPTKPPEDQRSTCDASAAEQQAAAILRRRERERGHSMSYRERQARKRAQQAGYMFNGYVPRPLCSERRREIARIAAAASVEARRARQQQIGIAFVGEGTPRIRCGSCPCCPCA